MYKIYQHLTVKCNLRNILEILQITIENIKILSNFFHLSMRGIYLRKNMFLSKKININLATELSIMLKQKYFYLSNLSA